MNSANRDWRINTKSVVGIGGCLLGLAVVYFGYGIGTESPKKEAAARANVVAPQDNKKPVRAMNLALGNMVFFAQDLGFSAKTAKDEMVDAGKIVARIEGQLQGMRELYRQEIAKNPDLAGSMTLQFNIAPSGEVNQVSELSSRVNDGEFSKAVIAEAAKWSFAEITSENLKVTCPLLFVQQGMDITTLVQWEKFMAHADEKPPAVRLAGNPAPSAKASMPQKPIAAPVAAKAAPVAPPTTESIAKPDGKVFQIKYATVLRKEPNFAAASITSFTIGTKVTVLRKQSDWLEIRALDNGPTGFIRKEFVTPVDVAHK